MYCNNQCEELTPSEAAKRLDQHR